MLCFEKESRCEVEIGVIGLGLALGRSPDLDPETHVAGFVVKVGKHAQADATEKASQKTLCRENVERNRGRTGR